MASPSMDKITASLETSLKNCSLNSNSNNNNGEGGANGSDSSESHTALALNSQVSVPFEWEQCQDFKTDEIFFINLQTGMKLEEDPRTTTVYEGDDYYSEDDKIEYENEGSYSKSISPTPSPTSRPYKNQEKNCYYLENNNIDNSKNNNNVLVVAGCKSCFTYYMVAKQQDICLKCSAQLMHFHLSENGSKS